MPQRVEQDGPRGSGLSDHEVERKSAAANVTTATERNVVCVWLCPVVSPYRPTQ